MGVRSADRHLEAAKRAGLRAEFDAKGTYLERGLLIGTLAIGD
jgi:hypothetical protein